MRFLVTMAFILIGFGNNSLWAHAYKDSFYRNIWLPNYHGERLNYCTLDGKCGIAVAHRYCRLLGYAYADQQIIDPNIGLTNYLFCNARCKGWQCNGFKKIRCVAKISHTPPKMYHYRFRRFVYPRYQSYRIDWCYDGFRGCGGRAAFSFCRRMGYLTARRFIMEKAVPATKAIGNKKLCFGILCRGFEYIDCYR